MTTQTEIAIAGVPWPAYKLVALALGMLVLVVVGLFTMSAGTGVIAAFGVATVAWIALGGFTSTDD